MTHEKILIALGQHPWKGRISVLDEIGSTNTFLKALAQQGAPHGSIVIAEHQTGGRGRLGRSFLSPSGSGIYLSVLLRPNLPPDQLMHLTCAAAVAMCDAVQTVSGVRPGVKWINDLVIGRKKLGGILTELSVDPKSKVADYAVIGVGINCSQEDGDFPGELRDIATSARIASGKQIDRSRLAAEMIRSLHRMSDELICEKDSIMRRYRADCITLGQEIQVLRAECARPGKAITVDDDGALLVTYPNGETEHISSGEVSVRGMYGYV